MGLRDEPDWAVAEIGKVLAVLSFLVCGWVQENPQLLGEEDCQKDKQLKARVYRANDNGRQSRPLGQNERFCFLQIRDRSICRHFG